MIMIFYMQNYYNIKTYYFRFFIVNNENIDINITDIIIRQLPYAMPNSIF